MGPAIAGPGLMGPAIAGPGFVGPAIAGPGGTGDRRCRTSDLWPRICGGRGRRKNWCTLSAAHFLSVDFNCGGWGGESGGCRVVMSCRRVNLSSCRRPCRLSSCLYLLIG